jgi:hypothetical protein
VTLTYDVEQAPEWGRCLKVAGVKEGGVTVYHGRFTKPSCTEPSATHTGKYEWYPGSVARPVFTLTNKPLTTVKLETVGKQLVTCTVAGGEGEITGAKTALMFVGFTGCTSGGQECHSSGFPAGGILLKFLGELVWQNQPLKKVSLLLNPLPGESLVGAWECPALGNVVFLSGSVLVPIGVDKMSAKPTLKFGQSKGKQVPSMFEGSASEVLTGFSLPTDSLEQTGLAATLVLAGEEATEVNAVY